MFGKVDAGGSVSRVLRLPLAELPADEEHVVEVRFREANGNRPPAAPVRIHGGSLLRPELVFTQHIVDDEKGSDRATGNADGVIQRGEAVDIVFTVKNNGRALARAVALETSLPEDESIELYGASQIALGDLAPGATARALVNVQIRPSSGLDRLPVKVRLSEESFALIVDRTVELPFDTRPAPPLLAIETDLDNRGRRGQGKRGAVQGLSGPHTAPRWRSGGWGAAGTTRAD